MSSTGYTHERYLSPLSWRYGSDAMRALWSEAHKRRLWRRLWVALAKAQVDAGFVRSDQLVELESHVDDVDLERAREIEAEIHHDLMSEVRCFAEQCPNAGGIIHLGATSMDIEDNADVLRVRQGLELLSQKLGQLLLLFAQQIEQRAAQTTMAFTHLQPAEPTTTGYRLAQYAQDLLADYRELKNQSQLLRGKGFKGAVGTSASYAALCEGTSMSAAALEAQIMQSIALVAFPVATQTYPRKQDYTVLCALAGVGQSLYKFAFDVRVLQSPPIGEWSEPFAQKQVGSSAMPFKRNPIHAEKMCSLARMLANYPRVAWDNAAHSLLERTLDDSANRRTILPEAFLIVDELIATADRIVRHLVVDEQASARLLQNYGAFAASERVLMLAVRRGGDRQVLHELLREHALAAWPFVKAGQQNPLVERLCGDEELTQWVCAEELCTLMDANAHLGDAVERAHAFARSIREELNVCGRTRC